MRGTCIGVTDGAQGSDRVISSVVFGGAAEAERDVGGRFVDIGNGDCEGLLIVVPAGIGGAHADGVAALGLVVGDGRQLQGTAVDAEAAVVRAAIAADECVGEGVTRIRIGRAQRAHGGVSGVVFSDAAGAQREVRRRFIHIGDRDRERLLNGQPTLIRGAHADSVAALRLVVG